MLPIGTIKTDPEENLQGLSRYKVSNIMALLVEKGFFILNAFDFDILNGIAIQKA